MVQCVYWLKLRWRRFVYSDVNNWYFLRIHQSHHWQGSGGV